MRTRSKILLATLSATSILATAAGIASGRNFSISEQGFVAIWRPLEVTGLGGLIRVRCNVTLKGSFHYRTLAKTRSLIGYVTEAALTRPCTFSEAWILNGREVLEGAPTPNTLPWHMAYNAFTGILPGIAGVRLAFIGIGILIRGIFGRCLWAATAASPMFTTTNLNTATGAASSMSFGSEAPIPLREGEGCPASATFSGTTSSLTPGSGEGTITLRLI